MLSPLLTKSWNVPAEGHRGAKTGVKLWNCPKYPLLLLTRKDTPMGERPVTISARSPDISTTAPGVPPWPESGVSTAVPMTAMRPVFILCIRQP
ncbi:MAG: hypothetical protein U1D33_01370, partial [bacterium]|nr:hypothetical protein [bacterium]